MSPVAEPVPPGDDAPKEAWLAWLSQLRAIPNANPWILVQIHRAQTVVHEKDRAGQAAVRDTPPVRTEP
jgi:hypothetical protein